METLNENGDPKTEKGPHRDQRTQMGTHEGAMKIDQKLTGNMGKIT